MLEIFVFNTSKHNSVNKTVLVSLGAVSRTEGFAIILNELPVCCKINYKKAADFMCDTLSDL